MRRLVIGALIGVLLMTGSAIPASAQQSAATIDLSKQNEPISEYIYGQFIEHLGRCIYGGLWAEMLEDRKFYYPVTGDAPAWTMYTPEMESWYGEGHPYELLTSSPWMIIGDKGNVSMIKRNAFVGEHTPRIRLEGDGTPGGIMQERLGLVAGKGYEGRIVLAGTSNVGPVSVSLVWGAGAGDRDTVVIDGISDEYTTYPLEFSCDTTTDNGRIEIWALGSGNFRVGTVSIMPDDNVMGWRADTLALLKELDSPVYRWPGGNFVSGYDWKDGIGDPDKRPPRKNPAWKGIEHNDVGIHEFMEFCRELGTEAYIAVNTGLGGLEGAREEIEYVNGAADTPMGKLRAENGHSEPYGVKWWAIGNEMYGDWQLGHMPLEDYVKKHNDIVAAMREVDPDMKAIAVGSVGEWSQQMLTTCTDYMELLSEHLYVQDVDNPVEHANLIAEEIKRIAAAHREYRKTIPELEGKDIRLAQDEWNYWYGANEYGELGVQYVLQDGLGVAIGLHEFFRNSDLFFMANYAQTVNVIGAIKTTKTEAEMESTGLVLKLYRNRFGKTPVDVAGDFGPLDVSAALSEDGTTLTIAVVNPSEKAQTLALNLKEGALNGRGIAWTLTGEDKLSHNEPGKARQVDITSESMSEVPETLELVPLSVTLYELGLR